MRYNKDSAYHNLLIKNLGLSKAMEVIDNIGKNPYNILSKSLNKKITARLGYVQGWNNGISETRKNQNQEFSLEDV